MRTVSYDTSSMCMWVRECVCVLCVQRPRTESEHNKTCPRHKSIEYTRRQTRAHTDQCENAMKSSPNGEREREREKGRDKREKTSQMKWNHRWNLLEKSLLLVILPHLLFQRLFVVDAKSTDKYTHYSVKRLKPEWQKGKEEEKDKR